MGWVVPYVVINILGSGNIIQTVTAGAFPTIFPAATDGRHSALARLGDGLHHGSDYVFGGGMRSLSFANGVHATRAHPPGRRTSCSWSSASWAAPGRPRSWWPRSIPTCWSAAHGACPAIGHMEFLTYMFVPLSVGMFPHLFQHWMTAKDVKTFRPVVILHPIFIMLVWAPCILLGIWAAIATLNGMPVIPAALDDPNEVLGMLVKKLTNPVVAGFLGVGIVSATMSLDSQFLALSSMFTHDILLRVFGEKRMGDKQRILLGRSLVVAIVVVAYLVSLFAPRSVYHAGRLVFHGLFRPFPPGLCLALLEAGDRGRRDRLDRGYRWPPGSSCSANRTGARTRTTCSWA